MRDVAALGHAVGMLQIPEIVALVTAVLLAVMTAFLPIVAHVAADLPPESAPVGPPFLAKIVAGLLPLNAKMSPFAT